MRFFEKCRTRFLLLYYNIIYYASECIGIAKIAQFYRFLTYEKKSTELWLGPYITREVLCFSTNCGALKLLVDSSSMRECYLVHFQITRKKAFFWPSWGTFLTKLRTNDQQHSATGCLSCGTLMKGIFLKILMILSKFKPKK